jgi:hypothetical protein
MHELKLDTVTVKIYIDPLEFCNSDGKPFGDIPENATFGGVIDEGTGNERHCTGYSILEDNTVYIFLDEHCDLAELLSVVAHELGHLIEGGFKKNPPNNSRYAKKHEEKANHYEKFTMNAYKLALEIYYSSQLIRSQTNGK